MLLDDEMGAGGGRFCARRRIVSLRYWPVLGWFHRFGDGQPSAARVGDRGPVGLWRLMTLSLQARLEDRAK